MKLESNEEFMRRLMTYGCPTGPLIHAFMFHGLMAYCNQVVAKPAEAFDSPMLSGNAWLATANWLGNELGKRLVKPFPGEQPATAQEMVTYTGYITIDGVRTQVDFQAGATASKEEKDAAFVDALAQVVELNYGPLGSELSSN